jgi:uncharacterized protein (TIGR03382 family)
MVPTCLFWLTLTAAPFFQVDATQAGTHIDPRAHCDSVGCSVSWVQEIAGSPTLWSTRVTASGPDTPSRTLAGTWSNIRLLGTAAAEGIRINAFDVSGTAGDTNIYAALSTDGTALNSTALSILDTEAGYPGSVECGFNGSHFLCAYEGKPDVFNRIRFRRMSLTGAFLDPGYTTLTTGGGLVENPASVALGTRFLVAWEDDEAGVQYDIYATLLNADGSVVAQQVPVATTPLDEQELVGTGISDGVMLAWRQASSPPSVRFARFLSNATVQEEPFSFANSSKPTLSWHDDRLLVAVERPLNGGVGIEVYFIREGSSSPVLVYQSTGSDDRAPGLARVDATRALFTHRTDTSAGGQDRVVFTFLGTHLPGETCVDDTSCVQGTCQRGVCASSPAASNDGGGGTGPDGGFAGSSKLDFEVGCGCGHVGAESLAAMLLTLVLFARRRGAARDRGC